MERRLFTSESVTEGHPDKICDQISDAILDALMEQDPMSRVACETCTTTGLVMVMGEITTKASIDIQHCLWILLGRSVEGEQIAHTGLKILLHSRRHRQMLVKLRLLTHRHPHVGCSTDICRNTHLTMHENLAVFRLVRSHSLMDHIQDLLPEGIGLLTGAIPILQFL